MVSHYPMTEQDKKDLEGAMKDLKVDERFTQTIAFQDIKEFEKWVYESKQPVTMCRKSECLRKYKPTDQIEYDGKKIDGPPSIGIPR